MVQRPGAYQIENKGNAKLGVIPSTGSGQVLSATAFQAERRISRTLDLCAREIPPPAGENAGVRDDAVYYRRRFMLNHRGNRSRKYFASAVDSLRAERL